jgi:transcriptional regulator with XRE-family HTH domain
MKDLQDIREIENIESLENEYDLQRALLLDRKLRLLVKEEKSLKPLHDKLFDLIHEYETKHWNDSSTITDAQVEESEKAEKLVESEHLFVQRRKEIIRKQLKKYDMTQQDLGILLGHQKSYMSELINGVSQFSLKDLVIIHRIFEIDLKELIPPYIQSETRKKIQESILKLNKPKLKLRKADLVY